MISNENGNERDLMVHRLEQSRACLRAAELLAREGAFRDAANRSYYCVFHAMRAILALDGFDSKKHSGVISAFRQRYIKSGKFSAHFSDIIGSAFEVRGDSDYEDFFVVSQSQILEQIENAKLFLETVEKYIEHLPTED